MNDLDHPTTIDAAIPDHARGFFHPKKLRKWVLDGAKKSFQEKLNSLESKNFKLKVDHVEYDDPNKKFTLTEQHTAMLNKEDLTLPLKGTFHLIDKATGNTVAKKTTTIARVPWVTPMNTTLLNGSHYVGNTQQRLRPGVYVRKKQTGEVEAHINILSGTGLGAKIEFNPEKAIFTIKADTTQIKLYGVLHDLGVSDAEMEKSWGKDVLLKNKAQYDGKEIDKYYEKLFAAKY